MLPLHWVADPAHYRSDPKKGTGWDDSFATGHFAAFRRQATHPAEAADPRTASQTGDLDRALWVRQPAGRSRPDHEESTTHCIRSGDGS
jgi:hypothetical protein